MPFAVHKEASVTIQLPDGIKLACTLWIPAARVQKDASVITTPHRFPAILEYLPYRKSDWTSPRDECRHAYFAGHGYLVARVDMRGSGNSGKAGPLRLMQSLSRVHDVTELSVPGDLHQRASTMMNTRTWSKQMQNT